MNTPLKNTLAPVSLLKNKRVISIIFILFIILVSLFIYFTVLSHSTPYQKMLFGTVFINGQPAPIGTNVSIIFPYDVIYDINGTNETGMFEVDVTEFIGNTFEIHVFYNGQLYAGTDQQGNILNGTISERSPSWIDVFIHPNSSSEDGSDDGNHGNDAEDDTNDQNSENKDDSVFDDSNEDSDSDSDTDESNEDESDTNDEDDNDTNDPEDPDDSDDSEDEDSEEDSQNPQENESYYLFVEKSVWSQNDDQWMQGVIIELNEKVLFNVTIQYNGSNLSYLKVVDILPYGLTYEGNATVNGEVFDPLYNESNGRVTWNITSLSNENSTIYIEYESMVYARDLLKNQVRVDLFKNYTSLVGKESNATVQVYGDIQIIKTVRNRNEALWNETTMVYVDDIARFNISICYNGSNFVSNITIIDDLPFGIVYDGNATLNNNTFTPDRSNDNKTLTWNLTSLSSDERMYIEFDTIMTENATLTNIVHIEGIESLGKQFLAYSSAAVTGKTPTKFVCDKTVRIQNSSWEDAIHAHVGDNVSFNVTILNIEMATVYGLTVIDTMPPSLQYIENTTVIFFKNQTYYQEPITGNDTNSFYWIDLNQIIQGYFLPNDILTIQYNASILDEGIIVNSVNVSSSICGDCDPLTGSDVAVINATIPIPKLSADLMFPEPVYVGKSVEINSIVSGGTPPYTYQWDLNNDHLYDDGNASSVMMKWEKSGNYSIGIRVTDNGSMNVTTIVVVNVTIEPLFVHSGGPYYAEQGEVIQFNGYASGGMGNYTWYWDFNDGNVSPIQNPSHAFSQVKTYLVNLSVTDERNVTVYDTTLVYTVEPDEQPPLISIDSPIDAIYYKNNAMFPFFNPLILGSIDITITAEDNASSIENIELYINDILVQTSSSSSLIYVWNDTVFGKQTISIKAYDAKENQQFIEKTVWKFF